MGDLTKNFSRSEFACKCGCGYADIDPEVVEICEEIRVAIGHGFTPNSGCRCKKHNMLIKGSVDSAHTKGLACDVPINSNHERFLIKKILYDKGIKRIGGTYETFVHFDISKELPQEVEW
jgi:hypothetical protein